eukprot:UN28457
MKDLNAVKPSNFSEIQAAKKDQLIRKLGPKKGAPGATESLDDIIKKHEDILKKEPNNYVVRNNLANLLKDYRHNYKKAREHYEQCIQINPEFHESYFNLGLLQHNHFREFDNAKHNYEVGIKLNTSCEKTNATFHKRLASLLQQYFPSEKDQCDHHYRKSLELHPKDPHTHLCYANYCKDV